jgi:hypothetical protein
MTSVESGSGETVERAYMPFSDVPELRGPVKNESGLALFVRPARGMTNMFYTRMETDGQWYWTPDQAQAFWMPCSTLLVSQGKWAGKKPAYFNVEIIQWLNDARPELPPAPAAGAAELAALVDDFFARPLPPKAGEAAKLNAALGTSNIQSTAVVRNERGATLALGEARVKPKDTLVFKNCHQCHFTIDAYSTKVHIDDCTDCSFTFCGKVVSAVAEMYKCSNVTLDVRVPIKTLQIEGCDTVRATFDSLDSFHSVVWAGTKALDLTVPGVAQADTVHIGVDVLRACHPNMEIRDDIDQFITRVVGDELLSERIVRLDNGFPTTERERKAFEEKQEANARAFAKNAGLKLVRTEHKEEKAPARNSICPCEIGTKEHKKYKHCCGAVKKEEKLL